MRACEAECSDDLHDDGVAGRLSCDAPRYSVRMTLLCWLLAAGRRFDMWQGRRDDRRGRQCGG